MKNMKLSYVLTIAIICFFSSCVQQNKKDNRVVDNNSMSENYAKLNWEIDPTPVLTRSEGTILWSKRHLTMLTQSMDQILSLRRYYLILLLIRPNPIDIHIYTI